MGDAAVNAFTTHFATRTAGNPIQSLGYPLSGCISKDRDQLGLPSNIEGEIFLALAYTASFVPSSNVTRARTFTDWSEISVTSKYDRGYNPPRDDMTAVVSEANAPTRGWDHANGEAPIWISSRASPTDYGEYRLSNISNVPDAPDARALQKIAGGRTDWMQIFIDLLANYQVKGIKKGHVSSYFAWIKSDDIEGEFIAPNFGKLAGGMQEVVQHDDIRALLREGKWTEYRTTFASTIGMFEKFLKECPAHYQSCFSPATITLIEASIREKHSETAYRAIPTRALGVLCAYLMVTEEKPKEFWGPDKAYNAMTFAEKETLKNWFTEAKKRIKVWKPTTEIFTSHRLPDGLHEI